VSSPRLKRGTFLVRPIVALVDARDAATTAADVIEYRFRHFESHAKALQAGGDRAAQVVYAPRDKRRGVWWAC